MNHNEMTLKRLSTSIPSYQDQKNLIVNSFNEIVENNNTRAILREEIEYLFDILGNINCSIEAVNGDKRYYRIMQNEVMIGALSLLDSSISYYLNDIDQNIEFSIQKKLDENGKSMFVKNILVEGFDEGQNSSEAQDFNLPQITKMSYAIQEIIDDENRVVDQEFLLKTSTRDLAGIENEELAEAMHEMHITRYSAKKDDNGLIWINTECPRGFANAVSVRDWAKLPKAYVKYCENELPYSMLSNLEFVSKKLLCSSEFKGFDIDPYLEDCDDKHICVSKVKTEAWFDEEETHFFDEERINNYYDDEDDL